MPFISFFAHMVFCAATLARDPQANPGPKISTPWSLLPLTGLQIPQAAGARDAPAAADAAPAAAPRQPQRWWAAVEEEERAEAPEATAASAAAAGSAAAQGQVQQASGLAGPAGTPDAPAEHPTPASSAAAASNSSGAGSGDTGAGELVLAPVTECCQVEGTPACQGTEAATAAGAEAATAAGAEAATAAGAEAATAAATDAATAAGEKAATAAGEKAATAAGVEAAAREAGAEVGQGGEESLGPLWERAEEGTAAEVDKTNLQLSVPCCACCGAPNGQVKLKKCSACQAVRWVPCGHQAWQGGRWAGRGSRLVPWGLALLA
jgi:hypothetical protein